MKASFFSFVAAAALLALTTDSAAPFDHDLRCISPCERARYEQAQREQEWQVARDRARWEAQHRHDRGPARPYGHR